MYLVAESALNASAIMKTYLLTLAISVATLLVRAQSKDTIFAYFDEAFTKLPDARGATCYLIVKEKEKGKRYICEYYYISGKVRCKGECTGYDPETRYDDKVTTYYESGRIQYETISEDGKLVGPFVSYYESGQVKQKLEYKNDKPHGPFVSYYENGRLKEKGEFKNGEPHGLSFIYHKNGQVQGKTEFLDGNPCYLERYAEDGHALIMNGNGVLTSVEDTGDTCYIHFKNCQLKYRYTIRKTARDTLYTVVDKQAEFPKGPPALAKFLQDNVKYPASAQRQGTEGVVYVSFVVGKDGVLSEIAVADRTDANLDREALRVVKLMPRWKPAVLHGRNVKSRFVQPIHFRLADQ